MIRIALLLLLPLLLAVPGAAHAQTCGCGDIILINKRLAEVRVALQAYTTEIQKMTEQMMRTQSPIPYTAARREVLQGRVQGALNAAALGPSPTGPDPGGTNNLCITTNNVPESSACMRESIARHEKVHQDACRKTLKPGAVMDSVTSGKDRFERDGAQLMQYASEEIAGYTAEMMFLSAELARIQNAPECKPKPPPAPRLRSYTAEPRSR